MIDKLRDQRTSLKESAARWKGLAVRIPLVISLFLVTALTTAGDWPTYLHDPQRTNASLDETVVGPANAPNLTKLWTYHSSGSVAGIPTTANGVVYFGSWDGYEYALNATTGAFKWKTFIGTTTACGYSQPKGVTSAATVQNGTVYVGGGDAYWYALDAVTGAIKWKVFVADNSNAGGGYNWASPLIYNGYAYIGTSSFCDNPLVQGQLLKVDLSDTSSTAHQVVGTFNVVPSGQVGGGIWTSPSVDPTTNTIYVTTGTEGLEPPSSQPYSLALVALDAASMVIKSSWQIPPTQQGSDSDWGNTPILFDAGGIHLVAAINKNGYLYTFDRTNISAGPLWEQSVAVSGPAPMEGDGTVSSGAFANGVLYMAAENTTINGMSSQGSVRAFNPVTGTILWEHPVPSIILPAIAYANGLIIDGASPYVEVLDANSGQRLYSYRLGTNYFVGIFATSLANGRIYAGGTDGNLWAFGLPTTSPTPTPTPLPDSNCPSGWSCQDIGTPSTSGSDFASNGTETITASGTGIGGTSDQFRFLYQSSHGNGQISAQVLSQSGTTATAQAGLMVRQSPDPAAPFYSALLTPGNGLVIQYRAVQGGAVATLPTNVASATTPLYLQIQRTVDGFVTATSPDGINWTLVPGSQGTVILPSSVLNGLAVSSASATSINTAVFSGASVGSLSTPPLTPTPQPDGACPTSWNCADIGNFVPPGSESLSSGTWTLQGAGQDLGGLWNRNSNGSSSDQLHFVWQTLVGNGSLSARIASQNNTNSWSKAGVMIRGSSDPSAPFYAVYVTPGNGISVQYRSVQGAFNRNNVNPVSGAPPIYLKVKRSGQSFVGYSSTDGSTWTYIGGSGASINMPNSALIGMSVTSSSPGVQGQATFDNVSLTGTISTPTPTNTPTPTTTPTPTNTPTLTNTPMPTNTSVPSDTPIPTNTSVPSDTPIPTNTSVPSDTPSPTTTGTSAPTLTVTPSDTPVPTNTAVPTSTPTNTAVPTSTPTNTAVPTTTPTNTAVPTSTPIPGGALSAARTGTISVQGSSDTYSLVPGASGTLNAGSCSILTTNTFTIALYNSSGTLLRSSTSASYCNWISATVTAGLTYTIKTTAIRGTGDYRSAWNVNGATVTWHPSGSISTNGGSTTFSFPTLSAGTITLSTCGPSGTVFNLYLLSASNTTLASATASSNCQTLSYTPTTRDLFRLKEVAVSGSGAWSGTVTTQ